jgi:hypothetical protein
VSSTPEPQAPSELELASSSSSREGSVVNWMIRRFSFQTDQTPIPVSTLPSTTSLRVSSSSQRHDLQSETESNHNPPPETESNHNPPPPEKEGEMKKEEEEESVLTWMTRRLSFKTSTLRRLSPRDHQLSHESSRWISLTQSHQLTFLMLPPRLLR